MLSVLQWGTDSTRLWSAHLVPSGNRHIKEVAMSKPPEYPSCLISIQLGNQAAKHPPCELGTCKRSDALIQRGSTYVHTQRMLSGGQNPVKMSLQSRR